MKDKTADKYITIRSVSETLSCSDQFVYDLIREGKLCAVKIGERALRISDQSLQKFIASHVINPDDYFAPETLPPKSRRIISRGIE